MDSLMDDPMLGIGEHQCLCSGCGAYFGGVRAFDMHRVGVHPERVCLDESSMAEKGLHKDGKGYWRQSYGKHD